MSQYEKERKQAIIDESNDRIFRFNKMIESGVIDIFDIALLKECLDEETAKRNAAQLILDKMGRRNI